MDNLLGDGILTNEVTEIVGATASGKTQVLFLLINYYFFQNLVFGN